MTKFIAISNSTILDVCMNTYGSLNYLAKLMVENNHVNINTYPIVGQEFIFDENLNKNIKLGEEQIKFTSR
jgi:hypothetical protein